NDVRYSAANVGRTATWTFTNLTPGLYTVAATWSIHANRATNAPYTVTDAHGSATFLINQEATPDDFSDAGVGWERLGDVFEVGPDGVLTVSLTDVGADEYVIADAIRIQPVLPHVTAAELVAISGADIGSPLQTQVSRLEADAGG